MRVHSKVEALSKILEAGSADPIVVVSAHPPFELSVGVVLEHVIAQMNPAERAMIVVPSRSVWKPTTPSEGHSREKVLLTADSPVVISNHVASLPPQSRQGPSHDAGTVRVEPASGSPSLEAADCGHDQDHCGKQEAAGDPDSEIPLIARCSNEACPRPLVLLVPLGEEASTISRRRYGDPYCEDCPSSSICGPGDRSDQLRMHDVRSTWTISTFYSERRYDCIAKPVTPIAGSVT